MFNFISALFSKAVLAIAGIFMAIGGAMGAGQIQETPHLESATVDVGTFVDTVTSGIQTSRVTEPSSKVGSVQGNYRSDVEKIVNLRISADDEVIVYTTEVLAHIDLYTARFTKTRNATKSYLGDNVDSTSALLLKYYDDTIVYIQSVRNLVAYQKTRLEADKMAFQRYLEQEVPQKVASKEEALTYIKKAEDLSAVFGVRDNVTSYFGSFRTKMEQDDATLEAAFRVASAKSSVPYMPPPAYVSPKILIPKTTTTTCDISGDTIYCRSSTY
jgi:hypothetical protein